MTELRSPKLNGQKVYRELLDLLETSGSFQLAAINFDEDLLFSSHYLRNENILKNLPSTISWYSKLVAVYVDFTEHYYLDAVECTQVARGIITHLLNTPEWMTRITRKVASRSVALSSAAGAILDLELPSLADTRLIESLDYLDRRTADLYAVARIPEALDRGQATFTNYLMSHLACALGMGEDASAAFLGLTAPQGLDIFSREVLDFEEIVLRIAEDPRLLTSLFAHEGSFLLYLPSDLRKRLRDHSRRWGILGYHGYRRRRRLGPEDYVQRLRVAVSLPEVSCGAAELDSSVKAAEWARRRLDQRHRLLFKAYGQIGLSKQYRRFHQLFCFEARDAVIAELSIRLGAPEAVVRCLLPNELRRLVRQREPLSEEQLARVGGCVYLRVEGQETVLSGGWVREWHESRTDQSSTGKSHEGRHHALTLEGQVACSGRKEGRCRLVTGGGAGRVPFAAGEILVTEATDADMVPYLRYAGGVITEQGGVTSHAAVVCRNLGIPALVGVRGALAAADHHQEVFLDATSGRARATFAVRREPTQLSAVRIGIGLGRSVPCSCKAGPKSSGLHTARRMGFSVPPFGETCACELRTLAERGDWEEISNLAQRAYRLAGLGRNDTLAIRSNALMERGYVPGRFITLTNVMPRFATPALIEFLRRNDACARPDRYRGGILLQRFIRAELAGIAAMAGTNDQELLVEVVSGSNERLTAGRAHPLRLQVDARAGERRRSKLERTGTESPLPANLRERLADLAELRGQFGDSFRVEWCWSKGEFWLLQVDAAVGSQGLDNLHNVRFESGGSLGGDWQDS